MEKALIVQKEVQRILQTDEVFLVGGSVRDVVLGNTPKDYDFTTPLTPDEMKPLIVEAGRRVYNIGNGEKHGTVTFKVEYEPKKFEFVEVTTHRAETYTKKSRQPNTTFGVTLDQDLARRDFTINAMVLRNDGTIYDPFGGRIDILQRLIKTVGTPKDRITEDPLRMLRAARFASQLDFDVDPNLIGKMRQLGHTITYVSKERWILELDKMLMGKNIGRGLKVLMQSEILKYMIPELWLVLQNEDDYVSIVTSFNGLSDEITLDERWAMLLSLIGMPFAIREKNNGDVSFPNHEVIRTELLQGIVQRLKFSNDRKAVLLNSNKKA